MKTYTIICVDDEETILVSLKEQLKEQLKVQIKQEINIELSNSAEHAIELFASLIRSKIDVPLIIADQVMPGMKGDELLAKIYAFYPETLSVLLTGQANAEEVGRAVNNAHLYRFISKPWIKEDLYLTVKEALHSYAQNKDLAEKDMELARKVKVFNKFVPRQFLKILKINKDKDHIELGQSIARDLTIMFVDICSFSAISEKLSAYEVFKFLNRYLSQIGPIIRKHHGFIDKYIGDAVMAIFLNPESAIRASFKILKQIQEHNASGDLNFPYGIGIGINSGEIIMGTVGEKNRLETTVIGDVVNVAYRTEQLTRKYNTPLIITEHTLNRLKNRRFFSVKYLTSVIMKGKSKGCKLFLVLDNDNY